LTDRLTVMTTLTTTEQNLNLETPTGSFITRGVRKTVLANGLTIITKEMHDKPVVATVIWYRVGSRNEELGQTGKSHFLEHMLFKGTDTYAKGEIDMITLKNGGANNAFTWLDFTAYYFTFAADRWAAALEIEADRMRHTTFVDEEFESEKQVVEEELRIALDGPWEALENEVWAAAFRQHPYHWPTVGWLQDLESASAADMKAYYDKWYHPQNATLVVVGDFNTDETLARIESLYGKIPAGPEARPLHIIEPPQRGEKRVVVKKDTPVERLLIGYHSAAVGEPDSYALSVLDALLSTGKASRLYQRLVEGDRSVTLVKANFSDHIDAPLFYIQAEVKPGFKLDLVEQAIYEELERLKNMPVPDAELQRARRQIEADLVLAHEEPLRQAILLGQYETIAVGSHIPPESRGYRYVETLIDRMRAVTAEEIARVAKKYLNQDNRTVGHLVSDGASSVASQISNLISEISEAGPPDSARRFGGRVVMRTGAGEPKVTEPRHQEAVARDRATRPKLDVERFELPNGLLVLLSENHSAPSVSIKAVVRAGSRFEPDDKSGLASLVGDMLDEGTLTRTSQQIAEMAESVGARVITFGDYQASGVQAALLSKDITLGLEITADVLMHASFPEDKVRQQVERRVAQIKSRLDTPSVMASDAFNEVIFQGTPRHRPPVGYQETVKKLTRDDMVEFFRRFYVPNNTLIAITGDIDKTEVMRKLEEAFGDWAKAPGFVLPAVKRPVRQTRPVEKFVTVQKEQVNIMIGHVGIERVNPDYYALLVMDTILGSSPGFTSRIPRILRDEQGLAYTTYSNITRSAGLDPGRFVAYIGTSPENLDQAVSGLRREIERIWAEPVSQSEREAATAYLTGNFVFDFQTNSQVGDFLIEAEYYGLGYDYLEKYPVLIRAVSVDEISRVTRKYLDPENLTAVVVGPIDESGRIIKNQL
jgi:zinc protease